MIQTSFDQFRKIMKTALTKEFGENTCPFWGNQTAKIVSISQAPSQSVIKNQKPFSDKSGKKLRRSWYQVSNEVFYNPDNFYFTAIGMYFPGKDKKGGDLKPSFKQAKKWLLLELSYLHPKLFLIVGKVAADFFFPKTKFEDLVFVDQRLNGITAFVLPHPSPVNIKWFKDHLDFEKARLPIIRKHIHSVILKRLVL